MSLGEEHRGVVNRLFDEAAPDYDRVASLMALGSGRWYRGRALHRAGLRRGMTVLDVAIGTGLVAREARSIVDASGRVIGIDPSAGMLVRATASLPVAVVQGRGERLPFRDASFQFVSLGYALRHLDDLSTPFAEFFRVLEPQGVVCILEITKPVSTLATQVLEFYIGRVMPAVASLALRRPITADLWRYFWHTIERAPEPRVVLQALAAAGFQDAQRHLVQGIFSEYTARKPARNGANAPTVS